MSSAALPVEEFCPNCGQFTDSLNSETGFCGQCSDELGVGVSKETPAPFTITELVDLVYTDGRGQRHKLINIDEKNYTAFCEVCNQEVMIESNTGNRKCKWRCLGKDSVRQNSPKTWTGIGATKKIDKSKCEKCGFIPEDPIQIHTHHKDHDRTNNSDENLIALCANCHALEHKGGYRVSLPS